MLKIACVLRSGGDFRPEHVARLNCQIEMHDPGAAMVCLTDMQREVERFGIATLPLRHRWPGWWSKMEIFANDVRGDLLFLDLDVTIVGSLADIAAVPGPALMRDVYRPDGLQSAVMVLPEACRAAIWDSWSARPLGWMDHYRRGGDQAFIERHWLQSARRLQDAVPGQIVSYKAHVMRRGGGMPARARLVVHHGKPRPWEV